MARTNEVDGNAAPGHMEGRQRRRGRPPSPSLSPKQRQILDLVGRGLVTKEIADLAGMTDTAVKKQITRLRARFGAPNRAALVSAAIRAGEMPVEREPRAS